MAGPVAGWPCAQRAALGAEFCKEPYVAPGLSNLSSIAPFGSIGSTV